MMFRESEMAALEALLFVAKEPLEIKLLEEILELPSAIILELLEDLNSRYNQTSCGLTLVKINEGYRLGTKADYSCYIEALYRQPAQGLSNAALEVLSIIAYRQPVTRGEIDFIRGVQSDRALATLVERGLIKEVGRKEGPGRPILYGTTEKFLLHFELTSLEDLPPLNFDNIETNDSD